MFHLSLLVGSDERGWSPDKSKYHIVTVTSSGYARHSAFRTHFARTIETPLCVGSRHRTPGLPPSHSFCFYISLGSPGWFIFPASAHFPFLLCLYASLCFCSFVCMHACDFFTCVYVCTRDPSPTEMSVEPWASPQDQAAAEHAHSTHNPLSQDQEQHPDKLCLDSFWSEVETIRQGSGYTDLDCSRRDSRQSEGKHCKSDAGWSRNGQKKWERCSHVLIW